MANNMKQLINNKYNDLSSTSKVIAKFIIDNYHQSMMLGSAELAKAAGVSNTAVIRFAKALGFSGFIEYKNTLKKEYTSTQKVYSYLAMMEPNSKGEYLSNYFKAIKHDINEFALKLDKSILDSFCREILDANTVYIMGIGSDSIVVDFLQNYLTVMGIKCVPVYEEGLTLKEKLFLINKNDILILSAFPTLMDDEIWASEYAHINKAKLLIMTDSEITARQLKADYFACIYESPDTFFNSYILAMFFCNVLLLHLYEMAPDKTKKAMKSYQDMLANFK